jgi:FKBP-type peptidyl-prolyl cis-trans isomerase 2
MRVVGEGDEVSISCEIKLENGDVCFKNEEENYIDIVVGEGRFFPLVERELTNMKEGETKTITLEPKDTFGPYIDKLVMETPKDIFRSEVDLNIGSRVKIATPSGEIYYGTIIKLTDEALTLDLNHPLAGKKIILTLTVNSINEKQQSKSERKSRFQLKIPKMKQKGKSKISIFNPLKSK